MMRHIIPILLLTCLSCLTQPIPPLPVPVKVIRPTNAPFIAPRTNRQSVVEYWFTSLDTNSIGYLQYATNANGPWTNLIETRIDTNGCITNRFLLGVNPVTNQFYRTKISYLQ